MFIRKKLLSVLLLALVLMACVASLQGLAEPFSDAVEHTILLQLRLPVVLTAMFVGAALAVSSAVLQILLRNPLADPGIIGITSGASLCAALVLLLGGTFVVANIHYVLPIVCFAGALLSTFLIGAIAKRLPDVSTAIILTGIAISTLCGAVIAWLFLFSDAQSLRNLTFWLMGSLHQSDWTILSIALPLMTVLISYSIVQGRKLNWYYFGDNDALLSGLNVKVFSRNMLICSAVLVGAAVSIAGSIAFVGLLVPHLLRNFFGFNNQFILPASALVGAILMLLVVLFSSAFGGISIPVSMITATLGGPIFLFSIIKTSKYSG